MNNNLHDHNCGPDETVLWSHPIVECDGGEHNWFLSLENDEVAYERVTTDNIFVLSSAIDKLEFVMRQTYYTVGLRLKQILPHLQGWCF